MLRRHVMYRVTFLFMITDLVSDYLLKPMIKTTLTLQKMSWSAILTDIRRRRNDLGHSTHSCLILNDVRQSTMTRLKNQHINNCTAQQYTAKSLDKLNMNMIKHFLTTRAPAVQKELRNVGARHTRSSERNYHRASSTTLDVFLILSRPSVVYFPNTHHDAMRKLVEALWKLCDHDSDDKTHKSSDSIVCSSSDVRRSIFAVKYVEIADCVQ